MNLNKLKIYEINSANYPTVPAHLDNMLSLSISHTQDYVSRVCSLPCPYVGLDRKPFVRKLKRSHKFVNEEEAKYIDEKTGVSTCILWGAKEVLYKIYGKGNVDFRGHLSVAPFQCTDKGSTEATIRMPDFERTFLVHFEKTENRMLAYATGE
ncbi:MAG: 4'-phosphopantetheinyl transferase superfamily protein [Bacteroidetes bacterium]|nr:4'-phosphopantetheinyl transferase superfamily protein [Bacteroidota bacterium]